MQPGTEVSSNTVLSRLHADALTDAGEILSLFAEAQERQLILQGRRTLKGEAEQARIRAVSPENLLIKPSHLEQRAGTSVLLSFSTKGRTYSFSAVAIDDMSAQIARLAMPSVVYVAERRDRQRRTPVQPGADPRFVHLQSVDATWAVEGQVEDLSPVGLNVRLPGAAVASLGESLQVTFSEGDLAGATRWGMVRYVEGEIDQTGWKRIGLSVSEARHAPPIEIERRSRISASRLGRIRTGLNVLSAGARSATSRILPQTSGRGSAIAVEIADFANARGEGIRAVIDRSHLERPVTGVIIPPAWGRTKETLLPLAMTIVETFRQAGERVAVLRFDGTRRRGESFKDPGCERPGLEHLTFKFSHAIEDIVAASKFAREPDGLGCERCVLVTFSAASIEGRRAFLESGTGISGWVSVVGTPDLQSGLRAVSGGVDFVGGAERGVKFGLQEIMGVLTDIDSLMDDAIQSRLPFLEDARREMEKIDKPVTWIHGAHDGWLDIERVREVMSCGNADSRRLVEVPTGHQLRSSVEALEVFQLVAQEVARVALGRPVPGAVPNLVALEAKRAAERGRLPKVDARLQELWRDYLVGRDGRLGIELMNATTAYDGLMRLQIDGLRLRAGHRVADVGSGTGSFPIALLARDDTPPGLTIHEIDFVAEAHARARERLRAIDARGSEIEFIQCNLDDAAARSAVFSAAPYDAIVASLVLGYLPDPLSVLKDLRLALRNGGRLVISAMRRDADVSRLFVEAIEELREGRARTILGEEGEKILDVSARQFLNDAARILDLEEAGIFRFLDTDELRELVQAAGFEPVEEHLAFGDPPQAVVLIAETRG